MEIIFLSLVILASFAVLLKSADYIIFGITNYAKKLGLSDAIIGLVIVSMAASSPEIITSISGFLVGDLGVAMGTIIGSNMVHLTLIIGTLSLIGKKINLSSEIFKDAKLIIFCLFILLFILMSDGTLSRIDGIILLACFFGYLGFLWKKEGTLGKIKKNVKLDRLYMDALVFLGSLISLLIAGQILVYGVVNLSNALNVSSYFIALVLIGVGSTLPDFMVCLQSIKQKHQGVGVGDLLGSTIIEFLLFFGIVAVIKPLVIEWTSVMIAAAFLIVSFGLLLIFLQNKVVTWKHGLVMVGIYLLFIGLQYYI
ncbi:sodium:calcium antiporter [Candidatus Woesearchaeota archaeon]|nr:sodium:calcium antiporter [Candidatus Woesearchaeota archaeon]